MCVTFGLIEKNKQKKTISRLWHLPLPVRVPSAQPASWTAPASRSNTGWPSPPPADTHGRTGGKGNGFFFRIITIKNHPRWLQSLSLNNYPSQRGGGRNNNGWWCATRPRAWSSVMHLCVCVCVFVVCSRGGEENVPLSNQMSKWLWCYIILIKCRVCVWVCV